MKKLMIILAMVLMCGCATVKPQPEMVAANFFQALGSPESQQAINTMLSEMERKQGRQQWFEQAQGKVFCCCTTISGNTCCGWVTYCGGYIPGCPCK